MFAGGWRAPAFGSLVKTIIADYAKNARPEETLIGDYRKLNDAGKEEAGKRVRELTQIEEYTQEGEAKNDVPASA